MYKNALKKDLIRVVEDLDGTVESTDTIAKLKTKIEKSSTFESDADFVKTLIKNCIDERVSRNEREATLEKQKIELAKLQLAQLEKEVELQTAKNKALSLNPAAKVEEKQFETNIENMIKSIKTLSLPVPTRSENFNLFFQSLERAFLNKKINDEYKSEILINLLGERAHNVLLYIKKEELNNYEKLKSIVLREFQDLLISDKLFETLNKETATHIGIREAEYWFRPIDLAKEGDIYISSRSGSRKETPIACGYTEDPFKNRPRKIAIPKILKDKIKIATYAVIHLITQEIDSSSDPSNAVMDMNDLKPTPKIARPLKETLAMFRKRAKTPTAPSAAARAAAGIEEEHRMKIKYMEMDEERKNEEHQLRMEQLRIKIAHAKEKIKVQKILVTTLKSSPKIYLQNTE
ncbi:integrase catalytic domain-containing protein [Trichonephila clavipes]|uniref:Integrase catalytic domain-containing protein n=1 Tax=Trichonephila clavipes TaxID=2585209 RepID=A0A8X6VJQ5_TRICX|nr:integrase catalytic domain-containing protein [Trichonephila clavipes]